MMPLDLCKVAFSGHVHVCVCVHRILNTNLVLSEVRFCSDECFEAVSLLLALYFATAEVVSWTCGSLWKNVMKCRR